MALTKTGRALLKVAANRLRELQEENEELRERQQKEALVDEVMNLLRERDQVTEFSAQEKRAELEKKSIDELEQAKQIIEDYVSSGQFKIGEVANDSEQYSDSIMRLLFN